MKAARITRPVALVTGASRRIGRAVALRLATRGWDVGVHYHTSRDDALAVVAEIEALGRRAKAFPATLSDIADVEGLVPSVVKGLGYPSVLVNNASEFRQDCVDSTDIELWSRHFDVNLRAPVFLARDLARHLPDGADANVINIIDQRVLRLTADFFSYTLSKAALWTATQTMAQALAPRVRVNAIGPGPILRSVHQTEADFAAECNATLLKRRSSPDEIAAAVSFILEAPAMTGQMIALDGGQHLV